MNHSLDKTTAPTIAHSVRLWLFVGVVLVFVQVLIGGITRLTDSGLSITEWEVISGTLPPLNEAAWVDAFEKYKVAAKKQFETLHADMTLSEFKVIYFWEYFHRLWARSMGLIFLIPFLIFYTQKMLPRWLLKRLGVVILLAIAAATFGIIMVYSGFNDDKRTWVSAYKLIGHLSIATTLFAYLFWTWLKTRYPRPLDSRFVMLRKWGHIVTGVIVVQIIFGGLMAGMRAGLIHPYYPFFVEGERLLAALQGNVSAAAFIDYEIHSSVKAIVQILHRGTAYILFFIIVYFFICIRNANTSSLLQRASYMLVTMLVIQFLLGILTIINSFGKIPLTYGVMHQGGALVLLSVALFINYHLQSSGSK